MGNVVRLRARSHAEESLGAPSDGELVTAALGGLDGYAPERAKEALYRRHARMVFGLAHRLLGRPDQVDDVAQDAFVIAFERLETLADREAFGSWVGGIVVRLVHRRMRRSRLLRRLGIARAAPIDPDTLVAREAAPDVGAELRILYAMLEELPVDVRVALVLRRVEGLALGEIATRMEVSLATVKRRVSDGEALLAARMALRPYAAQPEEP